MRVGGCVSLTEIKPGDTVLLPVVMGMTHAEIADLRAELADAFPGVRWSIQRETMITDALVYRASESAPGPDARLERYRFKLWTALDLLDKMLGIFEAGRASDGGVHCRSAGIPTEDVEFARGWVAKARREIEGPGDD